jgi:uncharacterized protein (DUF1810 family)
MVGMADPFALSRFVTAQDNGGILERAVAELRRGQKQSHWMWFVFPQLDGLGRSNMARLYAISGLAEARAYLAHPVLGPRLEACAAIVAGTQGRTAADIFGPVDAMKLRSSVTLFAQADRGRPAFQQILDRYFDGIPDPVTAARLQRSSPR